jgi:hypothetical protein
MTLSAAIGNGPTRAIFRAGIQALVQNSSLFGLQGDFYHLTLLQISASPRQSTLWAAGFWCALHMIALGLIPDPITPWLFYAVVFGKEGLPKDLDYIRTLDPASAQLLEPWFQFHPDDVLSPADFSNPVCQLLVQYLNIHDVGWSLDYEIHSMLMFLQLSLFTAPRTLEFHNATSQALITALLLGHSDPWDLSEFQAFKDGFNLDFGSKKLVQVSIFLCPLSHFIK